MTLKLVRRNDQVIVAAEAHVADQYFTRLVGLIGKKSLGHGEGMLFPKCNSAHMWWMSMPIDVIFLKKQNSESWMVLDVKANLKPWKPLPVSCFRADDMLEVASGTAERINLKVGEVLCIA